MTSFAFTGAVTDRVTGERGTKSVNLTVAPGHGAAVGDNCATAQYGGGTYAQAVTNWQAKTGRTMAAHRYYMPGGPPAAIPADVQTDITAGRAVALSCKPSTTIPSTQATTDRNNLALLLAACKAAGMAGSVTMYHEPSAELGSASVYAAVQAFYGPTVVAAGYPLNYSGMCNAQAGNLANYQAYYAAAKAAGAVFGSASVDHYQVNWMSGQAGHALTGINIKDWAAVTDADGLGFGCLECGTNETVFPAALVSQWWKYMGDFFAGRLAAGLVNTIITHFTASTPGPDSQPSFMTCRASQIADWQAMYDRV